MAAVVWLGEAEASQVALVGGKAANLTRLLAAGFRVPAGFVLTTEAWHRRSGGGPSAADLDELRAAYRRLVGNSGAGVAVRSSATAEDLAAASFAGQLETVLGVPDEEALLAAVRHCWESPLAERAVAYRDRQDVPEDSFAVAVVVQLMVDAIAAGVMFTADPVTGARDRTVVTAAWGLGEGVVSGAVDPDTFVVDPAQGVVLERTPGRKQTMAVLWPGVAGAVSVPVAAERSTQLALSDALVLELAALGGRIQALDGVPQDIEWALAADGLHVLQTRPVTALPEPAAPVADDWPCEPGNMYFRASIIEQLPEPLTPLFADLMASAVPASLQALMDDLGAMAGVGNLAGLDVGFPTVNGYAYYRYSNDAMRRVSATTVPAMRVLYRAGGQLIIERWRAELRRYRELAGRWRSAELSALAPGDLLGAVAELLAGGCRYYTAVQTIIPLAGTAELSWNAVLAAMVGGRRVSPERYLIGFDSAPLAAEKALWELADRVRADDDLVAALLVPGCDVAGAAPAGVAPQVWEQWRARWAGYLAEYGHTVYDLDFVNPVPADEPEPILHGLRFILTGAATNPGRRQAGLAAERERLTADLLGSLDPPRRRLAERNLRWAQRIVPIREDALASLGLAWPVMRWLLAELGRRLAGAGAVVEAEDVFWLTLAEARAAAVALDGGADVESLAAQVAARRALRRGQQRLTPPQYLPVNRLMSLGDSFLPARAGQGSGPVLKGNAGSGGVVTGPARVISGPADFAAFQPGEILVAEITTVAYTPLFAAAGGVVTDVGGVLSHGSIVAREYGIPAVLGTGSATARIRTGDVVTVDGGRGEVRLAGAGPEPAGVDWKPWLVAGAAAAAGVVLVRRAVRRRGRPDQGWRRAP